MSDDYRSSAAWNAGVEAYRRGDPKPSMEDLDFIGGYSWAECNASRIEPCAAAILIVLGLCAALLGGIGIMAVMT